MNSLTHHRRVARRRRAAYLLSFAGLAVLVLGFVLNLRQAFGLAFAALLLGTGLSWAGLALADRWIARPRPDLALAEGLGDRTGRVFKLYNWCLPADHVFAAPWGLTVFAVFNQEGRARIEGARWRDARPFWQRLLSFGRRPLRHPGRLLVLDEAALREALGGAALDLAPELAEVPIEGIAVFTHPGVGLERVEPDLPVLRAAELADWVAEGMRRPRLPIDTQRRLIEALDAIARRNIEGVSEENPAAG